MSGPYAPGSPRAAVDVALVVPRSGPAGIFGPSAEMCAELAVAEINEGGGVLGRELRVLAVDGGRGPDEVAGEVDDLISSGAVAGVVGWHLSSVRRAVAPRTAGRVPYVYTALYEGGERTPGVFLTGETPARQVLPALRWMVRELGVRRWCVVGDDYVWPRETAVTARRYAGSCGAAVCGEVFVPLGTSDFTAALAVVAASGCQGVLMLLVGQDAVAFNRQFAEAGLDSACVRLSPLIEENTLLASGASGTRGLYASAGYFEALPTVDSLDFNGRYTARFGADAPVLNSPGESCYEGVRLLAALAEQVGCLDVTALYAAGSSVGYDGPRGSVQLRNSHLQQQVYVARAEDLEFDVLAAL